MENTAIGNVWVFIEQEGGKIADVSLELVCKGRELADQLGVKVEALQLCMTMRGDLAPGTRTVTSEATGTFRADRSAYQQAWLTLGGEP